MPLKTAAGSIGRPKTEKDIILATIRMTIPPQKSREALKILRSMAEQRRDEPGCHRCHVYGDLLEKNVLMLEEMWRDAEDLDRHLRSDDYLNLLLNTSTASAPNPGSAPRPGRSDSSWCL